MITPLQLSHPTEGAFRAPRPRQGGHLLLRTHRLQPRPRRQCTTLRHVRGAAQLARSDRGLEVTLVDEHHGRRRQDHREGEMPKAARRSTWRRSSPRAYLEDTDRLGLPRPDVEPRATEIIAEIIDLVCQLVAGGHAYEADGSVYFRVRSFDEYGKLSKQRIDELRGAACAWTTSPARRTRSTSRSGRRPSRARAGLGEPVGQGPPGLAHRVLGHGAAATWATAFDIHGGGRDLIFPHHENEIAQSEAATGQPFAKLLDAQRHDPQSTARRWRRAWATSSFCARCSTATTRPWCSRYFLTTHYRSPLEFSTDKLDEAKAAYGRFADLLADPRVPHRQRRQGSVRRGSGPTFRCAPRPRASPSPSRWTTTSTPPRPWASCSRSSARRTDIWPRSTVARRPWTPRPSRRSAKLLLAVARPAPHPGARRRRRPHRRRQRPRRRRRDVRHGRGRPASGGAAGRGGPLGRRRARVRRPARVRRRHLRVRPARPLPRNEKRLGDADRLRDELQAAGFEVRDTPQGTQVVTGVRRRP